MAPNGPGELLIASPLKHVEDAGDVIRGRAELELFALAHHSEAVRRRIEVEGVGDLQVECPAKAERNGELPQGLFAPSDAGQALGPIPPRRRSAVRKER